MSESDQIPSASNVTDSPSIPIVDFKKRIQVIECYAIEYQDKLVGVTWHNGQLTYHKTDRKAILFGPKNVRLAECFDFQFNPPKLEKEKETGDNHANPDKEKETDKKSEEKQVKPNSNDLNSLLSKEPTLKEGNEFTFEDRFFVRIDHNKFVHHKPYRVPGEDTEKAAIRKRIKRIIDDQEDIFEKSGVLSIRKAQSSQKQPQMPVTKKPPQKIHSHLATVTTDQASKI